MQTTDIRSFVIVDRGPVGAAALILATRTTLAEHVTVHDGDPIEVAITDDIPYEMWGSGTQALWRLLSAVAYSGDQVSLYEVASRLDARNSAAAASALAALFGASS